MKYQTLNPYSNELEYTYPFTTDVELENVLERAHSAYVTMKNEDVKERSKVLLKVAQLFRENKYKLATYMTHDMGKLIGESIFEVELCADIAEYYANNSDQFTQDIKLENPLGTAYEIKQSTGIIMAIEPWNFPYYQIMRVFAPNYIIGNPIILKDSSICPTSAKSFADTVLKAGAIEGALTNLFVNYDQVNKIIADKRVAGVCLTGSAKAGAIVASKAGENLKKCTLELGGNDAFIVLNDANWDTLKKLVYHARLDNAGQICTASKRFIVMDSMYNDFLELMKEEFSKAVMGDPMDQNTTLAPLSSTDAKRLLQNQVDTAINSGASIYWKDNQASKYEGQFFDPTIITNIDSNNPVFDAEMFGPVAAVYHVKSEDEAIKLANNSSYGLGGSIISQDLEHAQNIATKIETGMSFINDKWESISELPFGGIKNSGFGKELGIDGFDSFVNKHLIFISKN